MSLMSWIRCWRRSCSVCRKAPDIKSRFLSWMLSILCSMLQKILFAFHPTIWTLSWLLTHLSFITNLTISTSLVWPNRWILSKHCSSVDGFHAGSRRKSRLAAVKFRPTPPIINVLLLFWGVENVDSLTSSQWKQ